MNEALDSLGIRGGARHGFDVLRGEPARDLYPPRLVAREQSVCIRTHGGARRLALVVEGLNPNWDAGIVELSRGRLARRAPVADGRAYLLLTADPPRELFIGNLLVADNPELRLTVLDMAEGRLHAIVHNPSNRSVTTTVRTPDALQNVVEFQQTLTLPPGGVREVEVR